MRPKDIGTRFETSVVNYLKVSGWPFAERRALAGAYDLGDVTGTPGLVWECKAGKAAMGASDGQVQLWLGETERERVHAKADLGVLVLDRSGYGPARVGNVWAIVPAHAILRPEALGAASDQPLRVHLSTMVALLRAAGYGSALENLEDHQVGAVGGRDNRLGQQKMAGLKPLGGGHDVMPGAGAVAGDEDRDE